MERNLLHIDMKKCTGCDSCVLACSLGKTGSFGLRGSRVRVTKVKSKGVSVPLMCRQCTEAPCVDVCPTTALSRESADNLVILDVAECISCGACAGVCPFEAITYEEGSGVAQKCDLCGGDPRCAKVCIPGAITFVSTEMSDRKEVEQEFLEDKKMVLGG